MNEHHEHTPSAAERLIQQVFTEREQAADSTIARLRFERQLRQPHPPRPRVRPLLKVAAFFTALLVLGGWATNLQVSAWDDGQQITVDLPATFTPAAYPHWVALFAKHAATLNQAGGHSLVVDYRQGEDGSYYAVLGLIGVDYAQANDWIRGVMADAPELSATPYSITQPLVPYRITVGEMIAFKLGSTETVERNVIRAWLAAGERPTKNGFVYIIARPNDYAKRVSMVEY